MKKGAILILTISLLSACGVAKRGTAPWGNTSTSASDNAKRPPETSSNDFVEEDGSAVVQQTQEFLQLAYDDWKGVPYVLGGSGFEGIDCSAFMQVIFEDYFTTMIPRTTRKQMFAGDEVNRSNIKTGDLVFFKTGRKTYHVGVMINKNNFLHASTSNGVKISDLMDDYWQKKYLTARRIL